MSLQGWQKLICECGNEHFQQAFVISWHEQHGTATKPDGWTCVKCGKRSDQAKMINHAQAKILENRISELKAQQTA